MYKWPTNFQDLFYYDQGGYYNIRFWKVFFRDFYFRYYKKPRDDYYEKYLNLSAVVFKVGSKLVPVDEEGCMVDSYAREISHIERLFMIISRNIDYKPYINLKWNDIVRDAEQQLKDWLDGKERRLGDALNFASAAPHIIKSPYQWKENLKNTPKPEPLWLDLWYKDEIACLSSTYC